jgi:hypothetical protein
VLLAEFLGWYGAVAILGAYALVSFRRIRPDGAIYQLLNLTGALGIMAISAAKGVTQSVILNACWAGIAFVALVRGPRSRRPDDADYGV